MYQLLNIRCTRYLLAIGVPKPRTFSDEDRKILEDAGFEIVDI